MNRIAHLVAAGLLLSSPAVAQTLQAPTRLYNEGDLKLESGEAIKDFSIAYVTYGALNAKNQTPF
jgi:homoserine O-acetyltransferase/O-succinyltransferase